MLVVDDDESIRVLLEAVLEGAGCSVAVAADGAAALRAIDDERFDVVLVDLYLPDMDGFELTTALRRGRPRLPVVIMTAASDSGALERAYARGAELFLRKPFASIDDVADQVVKLLRKRRLRRSIRGRLEAAQSALGHPDAHTDGAE